MTRQSGTTGAEPALSQMGAEDRQTLTEQLFHIEQRIDLCTRHIARQQHLVAELIQSGGDPSSARRLLAQISNLLAMHTSERNRLRRDLETMLG
jgi:hypothetical protein